MIKFWVNVLNMLWYLVANTWQPLIRPTFLRLFIIFPSLNCRAPGILLWSTSPKLFILTLIENFRDSDFNLAFPTEPIFPINFWMNRSFRIWHATGLSLCCTGSCSLLLYNPDTFTVIKNYITQAPGSSLLPLSSARLPSHFLSVRGEVARWPTSHERMFLSSTWSRETESEGAYVGLLFLFYFSCFTLFSP